MGGVFIVSRSGVGYNTLGIGRQGRYTGFRPKFSNRVLRTVPFALLSAVFVKWSNPLQLWRATRSQAAADARLWKSVVRTDVVETLAALAKSANPNQSKKKETPALPQNSMVCPEIPLLYLALLKTTVEEPDLAPFSQRCAVVDHLIAAGADPWAPSPWGPCALVVLGNAASLAHWLEQGHPLSSAAWVHSPAHPELLVAAYFSERRDELVPLIEAHLAKEVERNLSDSLSQAVPPLRPRQRM